jgi:hypothetical protein
VAGADSSIGVDKQTEATHYTRTFQFAGVEENSRWSSGQIVSD